MGSWWVVGRAAELREHSPVSPVSVLQYKYHHQPGPLSLVQECRGLALIGRELHSVATLALLCHKESIAIEGLFCLLLAGSLWHKG